MRNKLSLFVVFFLLATTVNYAQVAINTDGSAPNGSAMLDVKSSDKGLLIPRLTTAQRTTLASTAVAGLMVYDTNLNRFFFFNGVFWDEGSVGGLWTRNGTYTNLTNTTDFVGIGTVTPGRTLDVRGPWQTARISSTSSGATLEFVSTVADDWSIGVWAGSMVLLNSTNDFTSKTDEYYITTSSFYPWTTNTKTLGTTSKRWSNLYSIAADLSGNLNVSGNTAIAGNATIIGNTAITGSTTIGTSTPMGQLHVHDVGHYATMYLTPSLTNDSSALFLGEDATGTYGMIWQYHGGLNQLRLLSKVSSTYYGPHISVTRQTGNVAIGGGFATGYKLSVTGKIICEELRVDLITGWPDYVFGKDYQLMPLNDLDTYIQNNGHLPNIPEAGEIQESGLEVGEMQRLMMEKIEELSLYIIQQQKEIDELKIDIHKNQN